jgi:hypothetical protein
MKVSRDVIIYTDADLEKFVKEREGLKKGSKAYTDVDEKISIALRHTETDYTKRLKNLWGSLNSAISEYISTDKKPAKARVDSYKRALSEGIELTRFNNELPAIERYMRLASIILTELDFTETDHHNQGYVGMLTTLVTTSSLADKYMKIFRENGIDPQDPLLLAFQNKNVALQTYLLSKHLLFKPATVSNEVDAKEESTVVNDKKAFQLSD